MDVSSRSGLMGGAGVKVRFLFGNRHQTRGGQAPRTGECRQHITAGGNDELRTLDGAHAGKALDDLSLRMGAEPFSDQLGGVPDRPIQVQEPAGRTLTQIAVVASPGKTPYCRAALSRAAVTTEGILLLLTSRSARYSASSSAPAARSSAGHLAPATP